MLYWHVCHKISSKFCSIQRVFVNFTAPQPHQISEAPYFCYWGQHEGTANISYIYAEAQKVVLEVKIVSIIILYSLSVFLLARSLQLILEISTTYRFRPVIHRQGPGISPGYYECSPQLLSHENKRKIEPKEIPLFDSPATCYIYRTT